MSSAGIDGTVRGPGGAPMEGAAVFVVDAASGRRWEGATNRRGRFVVSGLPVGGAYQVEVRAIGYAPARRDGIVLVLGRRVPLEFELESAAARLTELEVVGQRGSGSAARVGPSRALPDSLLGRLPVRNRSLLDLALESPQAASGFYGISIGGQSPRRNNFQIDGSVNSDLYGFAAQSPGDWVAVLFPQGGGVRPIPLDAVAELEVLAAPFDVRFGRFTGGVISAVTRSGTNAWHGTAGGHLQTQWLVGHDSAGGAIGDFAIGQFSGTLGGPIVRNRLHFFAAAERQWSTVPYGGPLIRSDTAGGTDSLGVGIRYASATRFQHILRERYGLDGGDFGPVTGHQPSTNLFGKLSFQLGPNSLIEVSENYLGTSEIQPPDRGDHDVYALTSSDARVASTTHGTRLAWSSSGRGGTANQLTIGWIRARDGCTPASAFVRIQVAADLGTLAAGPDRFCPAFSVTRNALELSDEITFPLGPHRLLVGTHDEFLRFRDGLAPINAQGAWSFGNLDSLDAGLANGYERTLLDPRRPPGPMVNFSVRQFGLYTQDEWSPHPRLSVTAGLRVDVPVFPDRPLENPTAAAAFGIHTSVLPSGHPLWSPRLGVSWALDATRATVLRGGIGLFTGRPAYDLPGTAYSSTGQDQVLLVCSGADTPPFSPDPATAPAACRTGPGTPLTAVSYLDRSFRFPQELKIAASVDRRLRGGIVATIDVLYSRARHAPYYADLNLAGPMGLAAGEAGRALYGTLEPATGLLTPARRDSRFDRVIRATSPGGDHVTMISLQLERRYGAGVAFAASYTYSAAWDRLSEQGFGVASAQVGSTPLDGTLEARALRPSFFDVPHRVRVSGTLPIPFGLRLSAIYDGQSGRPYAYVVDGDANGDGFPGPFDGSLNDLVYVPRDASDISLLSPAQYPDLERYIETEPCLREQRGRVMRRNSCRNPWTGRLDLELAKTLLHARGGRTELVADLFNALNFVDGGWGLVRRTAPVGFDQPVLLGLAGWDAARGRGLYEVRLPDRNGVELDASRWRMQLAMRYAF